MESLRINVFMGDWTTPQNAAWKKGLTELFDRPDSAIQLY